MSRNLESAEFRELCGRFATGVVIVTAAEPDGPPAGMTANSFASVSLTPPLISINVDRSADFHQIIATAREFVINVLASDQEALSRRFAGGAPAPDRLAGVGYHRTDRGGIVLAGGIGFLECEVEQLVPVGDHTIVIGRVVGGETFDGRPLLYFRGGYHSLS